MVRCGKVDAVASNVLPALVLVPDISARDRHRLNCSYNQPPGQHCGVAV
jgi:hypothetical protein